MLQVVNVTEEFVLQLRVGDVRDGAVLVQGTGVAHEARGEVCQVGSQFLNHEATHLIAPDNLQRTKDQTKPMDYLLSIQIFHSILKSKQSSY